MRSIVRRETGEACQAYLTRLAAASGIKTPTREVLARFDRKRKKKTSNREWTSPSDPDAKVAKMKDGQTHLAHKAEHAVDLESGALVAVTVQGADQGDTRTLVTTAITAAEQVEAAHVSTPGENCSFVAPENCTPSDAGDEPQTVVSSFRARRFDVVGALVLCGLIARSRSVCSRIR